MATPAPSHTPHASSLPLSQHEPVASNTALTPQHFPVLESITLRQQPLVMSTTPPLQVLGEVCDARVMRRSCSMLQSLPNQPSTHAHWCDAVHVMRLKGQSVVLLHAHAAPVSHGLTSMGLTNDAHDVEGTSQPSPSTQVTFRVTVPFPHPRSLMQLPQSPTRHENCADLQGNTLHERVWGCGRGMRAAKHTDSATTAPSCMQTGSLCVVLPATPSMSTQGSEHADHSNDG